MEKIITNHIILSEELIPSMERLFPNRNFIFQQHGASCHTAKLTKPWIENQNIAALYWPSSSLDLNIIKIIWHRMKIILKEKPARTVIELKARLHKASDYFTVTECPKAVQNMPHRIKVVIETLQSSKMEEHVAVSSLQTKYIFVYKK